MPRHAEETGRNRPATRSVCASGGFACSASSPRPGGFTCSSPERATFGHLAVSPAALRLLGRVVAPDNKVAERFTFGWREPWPGHAEATRASVQSAHSERDSAACVCRSSTCSASSPQPGGFTMVPTRTCNVRPLTCSASSPLPGGFSRSKWPNVSRSGGVNRRPDMPRRLGRSVQSATRTRQPFACRRSSTCSASSPRPGGFTMVPTRTCNVRPLGPPAALRLLCRVVSPARSGRTFHVRVGEPCRRTPRRRAESVQPPEALACRAVPPVALRLLGRVVSPGQSGRTLHVRVA